MLSFLEKSFNTYFACLPQKKPELQELKQVKLIAHRGVFSKHCIENTMQAFEKARNLGCWGIELDIHATRDKVLVVNHDPSLKRLWGVSKTIAELKFSELRKLIPQIPTLQEVVGTYSPALHLFIELKYPFSDEGILQEVLVCLQPCKDYHLLSLNESIFANLKLFPKETMLLVPTINNTAKFCSLSLEKNYGGVLGHYFLLTDFYIKQLVQAKQKVGIGFINSKFSLYRELNRGLTWMFSNNIPQLKACLEKWTLTGDKL